MLAYLLVDGMTLQVARGYLTQGEAERNLDPVRGDFLLEPIEIESPRELVLRYYQFRGLEMPEDEFHALAFLTSELGELSDALVSTIIPKVSTCSACGADAVSSAGKWVRNNPKKDRDPELEAGDVLMMLYVTMLKRGVDPLQAMLKKFQKKGFTDETRLSGRGD